MKIYGYGKQQILPEDIDAVVEVLKSDFLSQGPKAPPFEQAICDYTGAKYCVILSNATAALHIAMLALDIGEGDEVITTPNTFAASANCVRYVGGTVKFADIESDTANINVAEVEKLITKKTKAIIPVHFAGQSCDMKSLQDVAKKNNLFIVEDAAHAIGSDYDGAKIGCCRYSDMCIFSFHPVKNITTGEGGAITTNNEALYEKLLLLRSHGITKNPAEMKFYEGAWTTEMQCLGYNYRMTDMQAALGITQLRRLNDFKAKRRRIANLYDKIFANDDRMHFLVERPNSDACLHLYPALIDFKKLHIEKRGFFEELKKVGLNLQVHYRPVYLHPYYLELGYERGLCPNAEQYYEHTISLPIYPDLNDADIEEISGRFAETLNRFTKNA